MCLFPLQILLIQIYLSKFYIPEIRMRYLLVQTVSGMKVYDTQEQKIKEANFNITTFNLKKAKVHSILKDKIGNIWLGFSRKEL